MTKYQCGLIFLAALCAGPTWGKATLLDDSGTWVEKTSVPMEWESKVPGRSNQASASLWVKARVDVTPVKGKTGRLIMRLVTPPAYPLTWGIDTSTLPAQKTSDTQMVLWQGTMKETVWQGEWRLWFKADGRWVKNTEALKFQFEFEDGQ